MSRVTFREALAIIEKVVVIVAGVLAIFPLWQYYNEAEDREMARTVAEALFLGQCDQARLLVQNGQLNTNTLSHSKLLMRCAAMDRLNELAQREAAESHRSN